MAEAATKLPEKTGNAPSPASHGAWAPLEALRREIDHAFENFGVRSWLQPFGGLAAESELSFPRRVMSDIALAVNIVERDKDYQITAELPGLDQKDVDVTVANDTLTIKGEKKEEKEKREQDYYLSERRFGSFLRAFRLPEGVNADKIEASFAKGILTVTLPKDQSAKANQKKIAVKAA
nr:Hsp20/alpha crystallin family protein [Rhodoligotrophos appendicifer]